MEGWRGWGLPSCRARRFLAPTGWRPSGRTAAASSLLPTPPLPAQSPKRIVRSLRASRAEPTTLQPRGGREPASRAPLVGDKRPVSSLAHRSAAAAAARGAASPASGRRWPRSRRQPALPASLGRRPCSPPRWARPAPVPTRQLPRAPARSSPAPLAFGAPSAAARGAPRTSPAPALRPAGAAAHLEAAPAPPWRLARGRHSLLPSRG